MRRVLKWTGRGPNRGDDELYCAVVDCCERQSNVVSCNGPYDCLEKREFLVRNSSIAGFSFSSEEWERKA